MRRIVLKTWGRRRTWQMVQTPSRASATAMPLRLRATCSNIESTSCRAPPTSAARSTRDAIDRRLQLGVLGGHRLALGVGRLLLGGEVGFRLLQRRGQLVGLEHPLEHLVFESLDLALRVGDLLLDGGILDVGLHRHRRSRNFDSRPCWTATSFSIARRAFWFSASCSFATATRWRPPRGASPASFRARARRRACAWRASAAVSRRWRAISRSRSACIGVQAKKRPRRSGA